jgi:hypothetical protein
MLSCGEDSISSDAENSSNTTSMQHGIWPAKPGADRACFPLTIKPGINIDLDKLSNPLQHSELFCTT